MRKFKESGFSWVPKMPKSWALGRLKSHSKISLGKMLCSVASERNFVELPYVRAANLSDRSSIRPEDLKRMWFSETEAKRLTLRNEDILLVEGGSVGLPLFVSGLDGDQIICFQNSINRLRTTEHPKFLFYWMKFLFDSGYHQNNINTVSIPHLTKEKLGYVPVLLPPRGEQAAICSWLDSQVAQIDSRLKLVGEKKSALRELKNAVLEDYTLRGKGNKSRSLARKLEWFHESPTNWKIVRLGSLFREASDPGREGLPMLSVSIHSGISDRELDDVEMDRKVNRSADKSVYKRVKAGDLVYNQMRAWQGAFGTAKLEGLVSPAYVVARPRTDVVPAFVEYLLRAPSAIEEIRRRSRGITDFRLRLYWDQFKNIQIALPPLDEQRSILAFVEKKVEEIDAQIVCLERLENLLRERRRSTIRAAVTGEVDLSASVDRAHLARAA